MEHESSLSWQTNDGMCMIHVPLTVFFPFEVLCVLMVLFPLAYSDRIFNSPLSHDDSHHDDSHQHGHHHLRNDGILRDTRGWPFPDFRRTYDGRPIPP